MFLNNVEKNLMYVFIKGDRSGSKNQSYTAKSSFAYDFFKAYLTDNTELLLSWYAFYL